MNNENIVNKVKLKKQIKVDEEKEVKVDEVKEVKVKVKEVKEVKVKKVKEVKEEEEEEKEKAKEKEKLKEAKLKKKQENEEANEELLNLMPKLVYDEKEKLSIYLEKVQVYKELLVNQDYDLILSFINDILDLEKTCRFKSLRDFKNITKDVFSRDIKFYNEKIKKYGKRLNIDYIDDKSELFSIIRKVVTKIKYKLTSKRKGQHVYYNLNN
jgi:centrosomal protein CEP76